MGSSMKGSSKNLNKEFFQETKKQSIVKTEIVTEFFYTWARVVTPSARKYGNRIAYIDLYAGPGRYENGNKSTPLRILEIAVKDSAFQNMLVTVFNDREPAHAKSLAKAVAETPGIEKLKYQPKFHNDEVGSEIADEFEKIKLVPTLFFLDPCGYKGLSLKLITSAIKNWGCDCIFFFNYNRINMGMTNDAVAEHMDVLFGKERADSLRKILPSFSPGKREKTIICELINALQDKGGQYVVPFCFKKDDGSKTSHYLIYVCKDFRGFEIMRSIMGKYSTSQNDGVPSFTFNPIEQTTPTLFSMTASIKDLEEELKNSFQGRTLSMGEIDKIHSKRALYLGSNYKEALRRLEGRGDIMAKPPSDKRKMVKGKRSFAETVMVTFP